MDNDESKFKRTLGATILELRVAQGITSQKAFAGELVRRGLSVSEPTVRRWEQGTSAPDAWEINRLCDLLGAQPADLIQPAEMTDREMLLLRRAARQVHRTIDREREVG